MNVVVFRQNTEGLYAGVEWTNPPEQVRAALATHSKFKPFTSVARSQTSPSLCASSPANAARKICKAAFEWAKKYDYKSVTICEKPNVLRETSGMMEDEAKAVSKEYPGIASVVDQHRRPNDVADEESGGVRRRGRLELVRRRNL